MNPFFVRHKPATCQPHLRLFCIAYAGAGASIFKDWCDLVPAGIEVLAVQLPGRETRMGDAPYTQMTELVDDLLEASLPLLNTPYILFGHSLGALIGFEWVRAMMRDERPLPQYFFASAQRAPHHWLLNPIHHLPDDKFVAELAKLGGLPAELLHNKWWQRLFLPVLRADMTLSETYQYQTGGMVSCPIIAMGGTQDSRVPPDKWRAWQEVTTDAFRAYDIEGGHFFLHDQRQTVLSIINQTVTQEA